MLNVKENSHIGCIVLFIIAAIAMTFCLGHNIKERERQERQELLSDTAAVNQAHRTYERVHHQLLMEDSDYAKLYKENQELKEELRRIKDSIR